MPEGARGSSRGIDVYGEFLLLQRLEKSRLPNGGRDKVTVNLVQPWNSSGSIEVLRCDPVLEARAGVGGSVYRLRHRAELAQGESQARQETLRGTLRLRGGDAEP